jgi:hypothetical protein
VKVKLKVKVKVKVEALGILLLNGKLSPFFKSFIESHNSLISLCSFFFLIFFFFLSFCILIFYTFRFVSFSLVLKFGQQIQVVLEF